MGQRDQAQADGTPFLRITSQADVAAHQIVSASALRPDRDRAFEWLERAYRPHDPGLSWSTPDFARRKIRSDPRWDASIRKPGLADDR